MSLYSSSSSTGRQSNSDGTWNVYCYVCHEYIGASMMRIHRAMCAMCEKAERGETVPPEAIRDYKMSKAGKVDVSYLVVPDNTPKAIGIRKFSLQSLGGQILKAAGLPEVVEKIKESVRVSREKKRPRLFGQIDLGKMTDVDEALKKGK